MNPVTWRRDIHRAVSAAGRINKQLERERKGLTQAEKKLANERFVDNAPAEVVDKERQRLEEHKGKVAELSSQIEKLGKLE